MKTRTVKDALNELKQIMDKEGMTCIGFLMNCRTAKSTIQLWWGDTRKRLPKRRPKKPRRKDGLAVWKRGNEIAKAVRQADGRAGQ